MSWTSRPGPEKGDFWDLWYSELQQARVGMTFKVKDIVYSGRTKFQRIDVLETHEYGRMLVLHGSIMFTQRDEFVYHELIAHVPCYASPAPQQVLIVGGGDGGALREVLKHGPVRRATVVEIDEQVVDVCRRCFPAHHGFADPRVQLVIDDGAHFVHTTPDRYEVILVDSYDPVPPADVLFQRDFFADCKERLSEGGILVAQTESPFYSPEIVADLYRKLADVFRTVRMFLGWIPTFPGALWSFAFCSDSRDPLGDFDADRYRREAIPTRYYNDEIHRAAFLLPNFVRDLLA